MQTTTSIDLGTDGTLTYDDIVVNVEWYSGTQSLQCIVAGAWDYIDGKRFIAKFEPAIKTVLQAKLDADETKLAELEAEWEQSDEARELAA